MDKQKASDILKTLLNEKIVQPFFFSIDKDDQGFYIIVRGIIDTTSTRAFLADKKAILYENKEENYCIIYEP